MPGSISDTSDLPPPKKKGIVATLLEILLLSELELSLPKARHRHTALEDIRGKPLSRAYRQQRMLVGGPGCTSNENEPVIGELGQCQASTTVQEMNLSNKR